MHPLPNDIDREMLHLNCMRGKAMTQQVRTNGDWPSRFCLHSDSVQEKAHTATDGKVG